MHWIQRHLCNPMIVLILDLYVVSVLFCSYYPLYPPHEDLNVDYDQFDLYARMPCTPHVFIAPSDLRYFIKVSFKKKKSSGLMSEKAQTSIKSHNLVFKQSILVLNSICGFSFIKHLHYYS